MSDESSPCANVVDFSGRCIVSNGSDHEVLKGTKGTDVFVFKNIHGPERTVRIQDPGGQNYIVVEGSKEPMELNITPDGITMGIHQLSYDHIQGVQVYQLGNVRLEVAPHPESDFHPLYRPGMSSQANNESAPNLHENPLLQAMSGLSTATQQEVLAHIDNTLNNNKSIAV